MNKRNGLRLLLLGAICVGVAVAVWTLFPNSSYPSIKLADGRQVTLKGVTFGTQHRCVGGRPWAKALAPIVPVKWRRRLGVTVLERKTDFPVLMVWVEWRYPAPNRLPSASDASVADSRGFETEPDRPTVTGFPEPWVTIQGWDFANFPRRSKTLHLKLYLRSAAWKPELLAQLTIPNPARRDPPSWTAAPLPATVTNGGMEFSLVKCATGQKIPDNLKPTRGWIAPWTTAEFRITRQGQPTGLWNVESIEATDATGNRVVSTATAALRTGVEPVFGFNGVLWPDEGVWKLTVEFSRLTNFTAEELWSVPSVAVPALYGQTLINTQTVVQGVKVTAQALGRRFANSPTLFRGLRPTAEVTLMLLPSDPLRLTLVRVIDDRGREMRHVPGYGQARGVYTFLLELPADSSSLDFTFALQKSRFVEFLVRPEVAE